MRAWMANVVRRVVWFPAIRCTFSGHRGKDYPRKLNTKKCNTMDPTAKSAKARCGEIPLNWSLLAGFTCDRSEAVRTNWPIVLANPDKKALYGYVVTRTQYANCMIPDAMIKTKNESMTFSREGVSSL